MAELKSVPVRPRSFSKVLSRACLRSCQHSETRAMITTTILRDIVPVQVVMEIQDPQTRYESHIEASNKSFLFGRKVRVVQHRNRIEWCCRKLVLDMLRERLLLLTFVGSIDRMTPSEILVKVRSYVFCCLSWWDFFHCKMWEGSLKCKLIRLCYSKSSFQTPATTIL